MLANSRFGDRGEAGGPKTTPPLCKKMGRGEERKVGKTAASEERRKGWKSWSKNSDEDERKKQQIYFH